MVQIVYYVNIPVKHVLTLPIALHVVGMLIIEMLLLVIVLVKLPFMKILPCKPVLNVFSHV